jgi:hypothetical protein
MIPQVLTSAYISFGCGRTQGSSETAQFIEERTHFVRSELERPEFYYSIKKHVLPEVSEVISETSKGGWDGYDAQPLAKMVYYYAAAFLNSLPNSLRAPTVGAEPDGHLTFDWYHSPTRVLSISLSKDGLLHYAAIIGRNKAFGSEVFDGALPRRIVELVSEVCQ